MHTYFFTGKPWSVNDQLAADERNVRWDEDQGWYVDKETGERKYLKDGTMAEECVL